MSYDKRDTYVYVDAFDVVGMVVVAAVVGRVGGDARLVAVELLGVLVPLEGVETRPTLVLVVAPEVDLVPLYGHGRHLHLLDPYPVHVPCRVAMEVVFIKVCLVHAPRKVCWCRGSSPAGNLHHIIIIQLHRRRDMMEENPPRKICMFLQVMFVFLFKNYEKVYSVL